MSALPVDLTVPRPGPGAPRPRHLQVVRLGFVPAPPARRTVAPARAAVAPAPVRLTRRGRRVLAALLLTAATAASVTVGGLLGTAVAGDQPAAAGSVVVARGDTLWGIATAVAEPGEDVRDVVAQIAALNDLDGSPLAVGQELLLPA